MNALSPLDRISWAMDTKYPISGIAKSVLVVLATMDGDDCIPSVTTLARRTNFSKRAVQQGVEQLVEVGLVTREARFEGKRQTSNRYVLSYDETPYEYRATPSYVHTGKRGAQDAPMHRSHRTDAGGAPSGVQSARTEREEESEVQQEAPDATSSYSGPSTSSDSIKAPGNGVVSANPALQPGGTEAVGPTAGERAPQLIREPQPVMSWDDDNEPERWIELLGNELTLNFGLAAPVVSLVETFELMSEAGFSAEQALSMLTYGNRKHTPTQDQLEEWAKGFRSVAEGELRGRATPPTTPQI